MSSIAHSMGHDGGYKPLRANTRTGTLGLKIVVERGESLCRQWHVGIVGLIALCAGLRQGGTDYNHCYGGEVTSHGTRNDK